MTGAGVDRNAPRMPGIGQDRADADHRVGRRQQHHVGVRDGVGDAGARGGLVGADEREAVRRYLGAVAHPPLLKVDRAPLAGVSGAGIGDDDVGFAAVVAGRQQPRAGLPALGTAPRSPATADSRPAASGCAPDGWPDRGRRARTSPAARRRRRVPPWRARFRRGAPSPRSGSMPPPRVYMQVSRSGQIRTPYIQASSPMLTMAVSSLFSAPSAPSLN